MLRGSCLCGSIEYEVQEITGKVFNCHCSRCRKSHGAAFATQVFARGETLKFLKGEEFLGEFREKRGIRAFCKKCGSRLMNYTPDRTTYLSIALASVDSDHELVPVAHAYVGSRAAWHEPSDDIPSFDKIPDGAFE